MADFALTVIGNTLGALLAAALAARRGFATCLVLAGLEGFDDSFSVRDLFLEGGLLLSDATREEGPVQRVVRELEIPLHTIPIRALTTFDTDAGRIHLGPTFEAMAHDVGELFPDERGKALALAAKLTHWYQRWEQVALARDYADPDPRALDHEALAAISFSGHYRLSRRVVPSRQLATLGRTPFAEALDEAGFSPAHRQLWDALITLRTGHLPRALDCLTVAQLLARDLRGLSAVSGGLDPLRRAIINEVLRRPGCLVTNGALEVVRFRGEEAPLVRVEGAGDWTSAQVICDRGGLMWQASGGPEGTVELEALGDAQRYPHVAGVLVGLAASPYDLQEGAQHWWVPRPDLPPTGPNGFWITHLPTGATLPNPPGIHVAAVHGAYLQSQLLDGAGRMYPVDDLIRRLWTAAQHRDERLQLPLEAFLPVLPRRVAEFHRLQTLLPDPRAAVAGFLQPRRLGTVPRCWWLDRTQHPAHDLRGEFALAWRTAEAVTRPTLLEKWMDGMRQAWAPLQVQESPLLNAPVLEPVAVPVPEEWSVATVSTSATTEDADALPAD